jgi:hypothetical protein
MHWVSIGLILGCRVYGQMAVLYKCSIRGHKIQFSILALGIHKRSRYDMVGIFVNQKDLEIISCAAHVWVWSHMWVWCQKWNSMLKIKFIPGYFMLISTTRSLLCPSYRLRMHSCWLKSWAKWFGKTIRIVVEPRRRAVILSQRIGLMMACWPE